VRKYAWHEFVVDTTTADHAPMPPEIMANLEDSAVDILKRTNEEAGSLICNDQFRSYVK
jgi:hypothetical protein